MKRIYPLSPSLTNQIAAGEVIERPASVVKELLENALDAGARRVDIHIEAGGLSCIEISDDGEGIHPDDLPLAVMSHATSKIRTLDDLFSIESLGFRGEALASISAVSRFSITSKTKESEQGYELTFDEIKHTATVLPIARSQGTTICVRDLFFNTPVRRKFLSSEKTECLQIEQTIKRVALSRFDVAFQLKHKTNLYLPAVQNEIGIEARVRKIFGNAFLEQSRKINAKSAGDESVGDGVFFPRDNASSSGNNISENSMSLWGWVGLPSLMRSQNDLQYVYLNGRMVRDKVITHAIRMAYEGLLYPGRQPVFLLYLEMPPESVDVNVHPTKHEVRFCEPRQVHDFIHRQLAKILRDNAYNQDTHPSGTADSGHPHADSGHPHFELRHPYNLNPKQDTHPLTSANYGCLDSNQDTHLSNHSNQDTHKIRETSGAYFPSNFLKQDTHQLSNRDTHHLSFSKGGCPDLTDLKTDVKIQWLEYPYALISLQGKLILCNYIELYQSLCKQRFLEEVRTNKVISRPLLVPVRLTVTKPILDNILSKTVHLEKLGLSIQALDETMLCIRSFPAVTPHLNFNQWIADFSAILEKRSKEKSEETLNSAFTEKLIETLIHANQPSFPISSVDLKGILSDFEYQLMQPNISMHLMCCYRVLQLTDWEALLKQ